MQPQDLGELKTVENTLKDSNLEAEKLIVGWVILDGDLKRVAFTEHEMRRPLDRAQDNKEDLPTLGAKPPTHAMVERLDNENEELLTTLKKLRNRGFWARLFNKE